MDIKLKKGTLVVKAGLLLVYISLVFGDFTFKELLTELIQVLVGFLLKHLLESEEIKLLEEELKKLRRENKELNRRIKEITKILEDLKYAIADYKESIQTKKTVKGARRKGVRGRGTKIGGIKARRRR